MTEKKICAIILAAGIGSRFGGNKLLVKLDNNYIIDMVIEKILDQDLHRIIVVTGHYHNDLAKVLSKYRSSIKIVYNRNYMEGISTSIKTGIANCGDVDGYLFMHSDQPFICRSTIAKLLDIFKRSKAHILIPMYRGNRGNPVIISSKLKRDLMNLTGDIGARALFRKYIGEIIYVETMDPGVAADIDTHEDLDKFKSLLDHSKCGEKQ